MVSLPFPLRALDVDNGGEFINEDLIGYCVNHGIELTRSRPYRKNDHAGRQPDLPADIFRLCDHVRETAFALHCYHRHGHLEKIYNNGLVHRLRKAGTVAVPQHPLAVLDEDGTPLGEYFADIFVENRLIVEIKACKALSAEHVAQRQLMQPFIHPANFSH